MLKYIIIILQILILIIFILVSVALFTLFERKIMANIQRRKGPNVVGFLGILQPFADGLKLLIKETILPSRSNKVLFIVAPIASLFLSLIT
jgi:NADH-quinone oxidoreductase subunit H